MANNLFLEILSPQGKVYAEEIDEVILPTAQGEIAILPQHAPLFTKLTEGEAVIKKGNKTDHFAILGGFLEISNNKISILADYAVHADSIDKAKAEEAKKKAEELLKNKEENRDFVEIEKDLKRSILELKITENVRRRNRN